MRYGVELPVGRQGIQISDSHAAILGIDDRIEVWGQWVEGRSGRGKFDFPKRPNGDRNGAREEPRPTPNDEGESNGEHPAEPFDPTRQGPHFVLSTIPPDLWPAAFRIEARLQRGSEALQKFLGTLKELNINVLSLDSAIIGFDLQAVTVFAEIPDVTESIEFDLDRIVKQSIPFHARKPSSKFRSHNEITEFLESQEFKLESRKRLEFRVKAFQAIGRKMHAITAFVEARIRLADALDREVKELNGKPVQRGGFLCTNTTHWAGFPWFLSGDAVEDVSRANQEAWMGGFLSGSGDPLQYEVLIEQLNRTLRDRFVPPSPEKLGLPSSDDLATGDPYRFADSDSAEAHAQWLLKRHHMEHAHAVVAVRALTTLAYARIWRVSLDRDRERVNPMSFLAIRRRGGGFLLKAQRPRHPAPEGRHRTDEAKAARDESIGELQNQMRALSWEPEHPVDLQGRCVGLASLNSVERSMRIRFLRPWFGREYARHVRMRFSVTANSNSGFVDIHGFLAKICEAIASTRGKGAAGIGYKIERITCGVPGLRLQQDHQEGQRVSFLLVPAPSPQGASGQRMDKEHLPTDDQIKSAIDNAVLAWNRGNKAHEIRMNPVGFEDAVNIESALDHLESEW